MTNTPNPNVNYSPVRSMRRHSNHKFEAAKNRNYRYQHHYSLNSLWCIWYGAIVVLFQIYIVVRSVARFTNYISLEWPNDQPPYKQLNAYVILTGVGVVILPFLAVSSMMKIGNNANDGTKLGTGKIDSECEEAIYENVHSFAQCDKHVPRFRWLLLIWKHSLPTVAFLHTLASLCFLISRLIMEAQIIKYGFVDKENIWKSELDMIAKRIGNGATSVSQLVQPLNKTHKNEIQKAAFNEHISDESLIYKNDLISGLDLRFGSLSSEFLNLLFALSVNAVRYPSVFWKVSKSFGLLFSVIVVVNTLLSLVSYSSLTVLYKMQVFGAEKLLTRYPNKLSLDAMQSVVLLVIYLISVLISSVSLYYYGLNKYEERQKNVFIKFHIANNRRPLMWGYCPHFCAFICLMSTAVSAIPLMYDLIVVYCGTSQTSSVLGASCIASQIIFYILSWLFLTFKTDWKFSFSFDQKASKISAVEQTKPLLKGEPPLLIIQNGKTFQIRESSSKNAILHLMQNLLPNQKNQNSHSPVSNEDIYWLKPRPPSPLEESKNVSESCSLSWLRSKKKCNINRKSNSLTNKPSLNKKKSNKSRKSNSIEVDVDDSNDAEYCTFRQIVRRDETDENLVNSTHLSLCPLKDETCLVQQFTSSKLNGDYEVFMEPNTVPNNCVISQFTAEQPAACLKNAAHNETENSTPCSASLSESSTSPEKSSETSSGIHSNSSSSAEKRSNSVENLLQLMANKQNWKTHSLQRYMASVDRPQRVVCVANDSNSCNSSATVRRLRPHTHLETRECNELYGRISGRLTSFSEITNSEHQMNSDATMSALVNTRNSTINCVQTDEQILNSLQNTSELNTDSTSAIALMYNHQRRDSANFSLASSDGDSNTQKI